MSVNCFHICGESFDSGYQELLHFDLIILLLELYPREIIRDVDKALSIITLIMVFVL